MANNQLFPIGTRVVHSVVGDVGRVIGFTTSRDGKVVLHTVSGCFVPFPADELRRWSVWVDGTLNEAYENLRWQCQWEISRSSDNFVCVPDSPLLDTLVQMGLADKKFPCWYRAVVVHRSMTRT